MKAMKIVLWAGGALVLLALAGAAIFAASFDANRYKADIERIAKERTGRTLRLQGSLETTFFPALGAKVGGVTLSERGAPAEFLSLESAHGSVALLPLLRGEVVVDRVRVSGLKANVVKGRDGRYNFSDLIEGPGDKPAARPGEKRAPDGDAGGAVKFDIAGVSVQNAAVTYRDLGTGQEIALSELRLETGRLAEGVAGRLELAATARRKNPPLEAKVALEASYALKPGAVQLDFSGRIDESSVKGSLGIARAAQPAYSFDLAIDKLNLDRYLAAGGGPQGGAPAAGQSAPAAKAQPAKEADAPVDLSGLKGLTAKGRVQVGSLQVRGLKLADVKSELRAAGGRAEFAPHSASLYGGTVSGALTLDGNANRVALKEALSGIAVGPLLRDLAQQERLEGKGDLTLDVGAAGATVNAMKRALAGSAKLHLRDGAIKGVDVGELLRKARSALGGKADEAADQKKQTDFSELSASFQIRNGVARNEDLDLKAPLFRIGGAGEVDLGRSSIDYLAKVSVVATSKGQGGAELSELAGLTVPVRMSGPLDAMKYQVDYRAVAGEVAKSKVTEKVKEKLEERIGDKLKGLLGR